MLAWTDDWGGEKGEATVLGGGRLDPKELGFYFSLAQVGMEMVVPIGIGLALDRYFEWKTPWGIIVGAVLGLLVGLLHLVHLLNRGPPNGSEKRPQDQP